MSFSVALRLVLGLLLLAAGVHVASGQEAASGDKPAAAPDDGAVKRLDEVLVRALKLFRDSPTSQVETTTRWSLAGTPPRAGITRCKLGVAKNGAYRLEVSADSSRAAKLVCVSDGQQTTRLYTTDSLAIFSKNNGRLAQVLDDVLTDNSLKGTGLNIVLRPDVREFVLESATDIQDHGEEEIKGRKADHFSAGWIGGSKIDFWVSTGERPVLLRWKRVMQIESGAGPRELRLDSELNWTFEGIDAASLGKVTVPEGAIETADLQGYLVRGGTDSLLGKPAPSLSLKLLDGADWDVSKHRGEKVVVLFFFATWATPSTLDMPKLLAFIDTYKDKGVAFYAVNAGESADEVQAFLAQAKYTHPVVLDPRQKATSAYHITSLPVTVMIAKDGAVQSAHVGASDEIRALIRQDLQVLVEGRKLAP